MTKSEKSAEREMSAKLDEPERNEEPKEELKEGNEYDLKPYSEFVLVGTLAATAAMWFYPGLRILRFLNNSFLG